MIRLRIAFGVTVISILILFIIILFFTAYSPRATTFSVNVNTEIVKVTTSSQMGAQFDIGEATVFFENSDSLKVSGAFLILKSNVTMVAEWISSDLVILSFDCEDSTLPIGELEYGESQNKNIYQYDIISIQNLSQVIKTNGAIIIPFLGSVQVGRNVGHLGSYSDQGVLKSGEITMIGKSIFQNKYFEAGKYQLSLGDEVLMDETQSEASGLIYIGEVDGLRVSYRIVAINAWIKKPGAVNNETKFQISTSLFNQFVNDQLFQTLSLTVAFLIAVFTLIEFGSKAYAGSLIPPDSNRKHKQSDE